ncbi:MAG: DUF1232 domain-containing protein [Actinomycetota bacterium]|nr:DUF1232 domain-containing protein [Actinomycetota bacterium]
MARTATRWALLTSIATAVRSGLRPDGPGLLERSRAVPRLVRATLRGEYGGASASHLALLGGAVLYILSPLDLVPEAFFSVFGLGDDALVAAWLAAALVNDTGAFIAWERGRRESGPDLGGGRHAERPETVVSHLVP